MTVLMSVHHWMMDHYGYLVTFAIAFEVVRLAEFFASRSRDR